MFSRRRSSKKAAPINYNTPASTTTAGTTAAQLAFFNTGPNATPQLSSAAAAAALRSHTTSPEPVGSIQTKRMVRRLSNSSNNSGSVVAGSDRPGLARRGSNSSMTDRTFRTPSPSQRNIASPDYDAPPVPPLPQSAGRPSSSLDAPQRLTSPTPANGRRSASADQAALAPPSSRKPKRLSNVAESPELDKAHSDFSRNFSRRDVSSPPGSPPTSPIANGSRTPSARQNGQPTDNTGQKYTPSTGAWANRPAGTPAAGTRTSSMSSLTLSPITQPYQGTRPVSAQGYNYPRASQDSQRTYSMTSDTTYNRNDMVYDANSRTFVPKNPQPKMQPALQAARRAKSMETVYDPNTRTFVPKSEVAQAAAATAPKKQQSMPAINQTMRPPAKAKSSGRYSSFTVQPREPTSPTSPKAVQKKPSVVREDTEAERRAEVKTLPLGQPVQRPQTAQPAPLPAKTYAPPSAPHERSASLDVPRAALDAASRGRNTSISPQRSAHFSASPILKPEMHAPPPRDVSPAKSAMKQSPASSVGRASPMPNFTLPPITGAAGPSSETSETPSLSAFDGGKKKKSARVSFDEQPREVAPSSTSTFPSTMRDRSPETSDDMDEDGMMKPRAALPSFASVRRDRMQPAVVEKVTEMPPERHETSSDHALGGILRSSLDPLPPEVTSKESAGYVSDESSEPDYSASAPTSGAVQSRQADKQDVPLTQTGQPMVRDFAPASTADSGDLKADNDVPAIALMPPTPKPDDSMREFIAPSDITTNETRGRNSMEGISIPGGWSDDIERTPTPVSSVTEAAAPTVEPPTLQRTSSSEDSAATMTVTPIELTHSPQPLSDIDEDTDDSAAFSDAVEDPSDLEDEGGFASLDAIVESPLPSPSGPRTIPLPLGQGEITDSSAVNQASMTPEVFTGSVPALIQAANLGGAMDSSPPASPTAATANWTEATKYWAQLSKEKREEMEREALSSDDEVKLPAVAAPKRMKPRRFSSDEVPTVASTKPREPAAPVAMKKTMRASSGPTPATSDGAVHMRTSMRDGKARPSSRDGPPPVSPTGTGALQKKSLRPGSSSGPPPPTRPFLTTRDSDDSIYSQQEAPIVKRVIPQAQPAQPAAPAPKPKAEPPKVSARLQKELSKADESDSESSFKKRRKGAGGVDTSGRYSMRRSMRGGPAEPTPAPAAVERRPETPTSVTSDRGSKFGGFRSLSPTFGRGKASTRDASQDSGTNMKTTLRGSQSKAASSTGGAKDSGMKTSLRSSNHAYSSSKTSSKAAPTTKSKFLSRFADSDDEDIDAPRKQSHFRSRFADSDEESDAGPPPPKPRADLAPVRGIPRRKGQEDGDSTDLSDEDDNPAATASKRFTALIGPHPGESDTIMAAARRNLGLDDESASAQAHDAKEGEALSKGSLRQSPQSTAKAKDVDFAPPDKKKKGFMSMLRRNRQSSSSVPKVTPSSPAEMPASPVIAPVAPSTPQQEVPPLPSSQPTSAAKASQIERPSSPTVMPTGKLLRRESYQMWMQRANSQELLSSNTPASPGPTAKSQPTQEINPYTLDLDSPPPSSPAQETPSRPAAADRPATSDGFSPEAIKLARTMRPDLNRNSASGPLTPRRVQIQAGEEGSEPGEREPRNAIYSQKTGKKKKFSGLRKAFGLKD